MEQGFYRTAEEWTKWVERLKLMPCPHCRHVGRLIRHGCLVGYDESQRPTLRARRVYCSNRHSQSGCGRTFSVWLADKIRRLSLSTRVVWRFLQQVIAGSIAAATRSMTERSDRTWQRLWKRFQLAQSNLRTVLLKRCPPPTMSSDRPEAQVLAHLKTAFPQADCPLATFQHAFHLFCL